MPNSNQGNEEETAVPAPIISGAIASTAANATPQVMAQQPRPPRNLQDVLRYSTEAAASSGGGSDRTAGPLDEESKRFLSEALASMTCDVIAQLKNGIQSVEALSDTPDFSEEDCDTAFENILELVDKIDFANDFHRVGGFRLFTPCLSSPHSLMRWRCCELIAELCQNNPYCQEKCLQEGYLRQLLALIGDDSSEIVQIKALYAVSCLVRESEEALNEFTKNDGFSVILRALQSDCEKMKIKSSFLLSSICSLSPSIKDELVTMGFVDQMVGLIIQNKCQYNIVEHLLSALNSLVANNPAAEKACRNPQIQLKSILEYIIDNASGLEEAKEVVEYAKTIDKTVFDENENFAEEDR